MKKLNRLQKQKGFTLVELAIVLVIIGLLIGGILKGQQLIDNARVTAQMTQFQGLQAAETSFQDAYAGLPGDITNASNRVPNSAMCATVGDGNGIVGSAVTSVPTGMGSSSGGAGPENLCFFAELSGAGYLAGISQPSTGPLNFGGNVPQAKLGAGLLVADITYSTNWSGLYTFDVASAGDPSTTLGANSMTPGQAGQIDRKMDDGNPITGSILGIGDAAACMGGTTSGGSPIYKEANTTNDCDVAFKLN